MDTATQQTNQPGDELVKYRLRRIEERVEVIYNELHVGNGRPAWRDRIETLERYVEAQITREEESKNWRKWSIERVLMFLIAITQAVLIALAGLS
ncbi:MAG: hypothetical protein AAFR07_05565 [Pseudomonadota bacterium]